MRHYKLRALVLKNKNLGDADRIYTFYTLEKGKVTLKARGVKKIKSRLSSHLETLNYSQIEAVEGRGCIDVITGAISLNNFKNTKEDISKISDSLYILEIIDKLFTEEHKNEEAFHLAKKSLELLDENKLNAEVIKTSFLFNVIRNLGHKPKVDLCANCGTGFEKEVFAFDVEHGGFVCEQCNSRLNKTISLNISSYKIFNALDKLSFVDSLRVNFNISEVEIVRILLEDFMQYVFHKTINSGKLKLNKKS